MILDNHCPRPQICIPAHVPAFQWVLLVVLPCSHLRWVEALRYLIHIHTYMRYPKVSPVAKYMRYHKALFIQKMALPILSTKKENSAAN